MSAEWQIILSNTYATEEYDWKDDNFKINTHQHLINTSLVSMVFISICNPLTHNGKHLDGGSHPHDATHRPVLATGRWHVNDSDDLWQYSPVTPDTTGPFDRSPTGFRETS